uniref:Ganglioside GM2 activator-like n=1 Tax=Lepisosteus oculatus TaxID=7918 RepID=W5N1A2_LEPOC|nr:PREDICTED: ganglioside GM2 activator-like isoform X1 [Lepisosteus oculatus]
MTSLRFTAVLSIFCCFLAFGNTAEVGPRMLPIDKSNSSNWAHCGPKNDLVIKNLNFPNTIYVPGSVTVSLLGELKVPIEAPLRIEVQVKKRAVWFWMKVPCLFKYGSCTYRNICEKLNKVFPGNSCPSRIVSYGGSCRCPIKPGVLNVPPTTFHIPKVRLPSFLAGGTYKVQIKAISGKKEIVCFQTTVSMKLK